MKQVFGSILMAVGILIAGPSGLCSLVLLGGGMTGGGGMEGFLNMLEVVVLFGGIPFVIGLLASFYGLLLVRQAKSELAEKEKAQMTQEPRKKKPTATPSKEKQ